MTRNIRIAAVAVIANGAAALALLSPPATAATCGFQEFCVPPNNCVSFTELFCLARAPSGCIPQSSMCYYPDTFGICPSGQALLECDYVPG